MTREVTIRLFGAFRQSELGDRLNVRIPEDADVAELRRATDDHLRQWPDAQALLASSAFASESAVLADDEPVPDGELSILPPVCGG
jgi:molybdopterin converting factor small subunit